MQLDENGLLTITEINEIIDSVLAEIFNKAVKDGFLSRDSDFNDFVLMYTEGGESNFIAYAIAKAQKDATIAYILQCIIDLAEFNHKGESLSINIKKLAWNKIFNIDSEDVGND